MLLNVERYKAVCARRGLDGLIATSKENVYYASQYLGFSQWLIPSTQAYTVSTVANPAAPRVVCSRGDADMALEAPLPTDRYEMFGTFYYEEGPGQLEQTYAALRVLGRERDPHANSIDALVTAVRAEGLCAGRIGLDERGLLPGAWDQIAAKLPNAQLAPAYDVWAEIRMVKTPEEIRRLTEATRATERAIDAALAAAHEGISEAEMARVFDASEVADGARPTFTVIGFGQHGASPNAVAGQRKLQKGDLIRFDVGCTYELYWSDIARTASFGEPTAEQRKRYAAILAGELHGIEVLKAGVTAGEVFEATMRATREAGLPHYRRHHVGHGIGVMVYDPPLLAAGNVTILEPGMVFEVETPYYELGFGGVQVEDTTLVTETGGKRLTETPNDLIVVGA